MSKQNIEFSSDKKAIAIFSDDENCLAILGGKFVGEYQAKKDNNACVDCAFVNASDCSIGGMRNGHCAPTTRKDGESIFWVKKEDTKMTDVKAPALQHRHFDLIVAWALIISAWLVIISS